jgi:hypothetical protein
MSAAATQLLSILI